MHYGGVGWCGSCRGGVGWDVSWWVGCCESSRWVGALSRSGVGHVTVV